MRRRLKTRNAAGEPISSPAPTGNAAESWEVMYIWVSAVDAGLQGVWGDAVALVLLITQNAAGEPISSPASTGQAAKGWEGQMETGDGDSLVVCLFVGWLWRIRVSKLEQLSLLRSCLVQLLRCCLIAFVISKSVYRCA